MKDTELDKENGIDFHRLGLTIFTIGIFALLFLSNLPSLVEELEVIYTPQITGHVTTTVKVVEPNYTTNVYGFEKIYSIPFIDQTPVSIDVEQGLPISQFVISSEEQLAGVPIKVSHLIHYMNKTLLEDHNYKINNIFELSSQDSSSMDKLRELEIIFLIKKEWLENNNIFDESIQLFWFDEEKKFWKFLPTNIQRDNNGEVVFSSLTERVGVFAIAGITDIREEVVEGANEFEEEIPIVIEEPKTLFNVFVELGKIVLFFLLRWIALPLTVIFALHYGYKHFIFDFVKEIREKVEKKELKELLIEKKVDKKALTVNDERKIEFLERKIKRLMKKKVDHYTILTKARKAGWPDKAIKRAFIKIKREQAVNNKK